MDDREENGDKLLKNIKELQRDELFKSLKAIHNRILKADVVIQSLKTKASILKEHFDALDREISMENRTIISTKKTPTKRTERNFTVNEIREIASRLGVEITIEE